MQQISLPLVYSDYIDCSNVTFREFLQFISQQATPGGNAVLVDDWNREKTKEFPYPKHFEINGRSYYWSIGLAHTKGRHLCTHYELWGRGLKGGSQRFATGELTRGKLFRYFKAIYNELRNN